MRKGLIPACRLDAEGAETLRQKDWGLTILWKAAGVIVRRTAPTKRSRGPAERGMATANLSGKPTEAHGRKSLRLT